MRAEQVLGGEVEVDDVEEVAVLVDVSDESTWGGEAQGRDPMLSG